MEVEQAYSLLAIHPDFRVLRRVHLADDQVFAQNTTGEACGRIAVIDTETTGLNAELDDRIIDIAIAICEYGRESGKLYRIISRYESLEDPECPISPEITRLTGITDEMVRDKRMVEAEVLRVWRELAWLYVITPASTVHSWRRDSRSSQIITSHVP